MGQIISTLGEPVNGMEVSLRGWEDLAQFKDFPDPIDKDPESPVGLRVDVATEAKLKDPLVIADLAKVHMVELEHKQEILRSELIKLRDLYNINRKSYNAVRKEIQALQEYLKVVGVQN